MNSTACASIARIVITFLCSSESITSSCALDKSITVIMEMNFGILVACVPTLGPIFFSRKATIPSNANSQGQQTIGSGRTRPKPGRLARTFDSSLFSRHEDESGDIDLREALAIRGEEMGHQRIESADGVSTDDLVQYNPSSKLGMR